MKCHKGTLFIAPASYFIENLEGQERETLKTESSNTMVWFAEWLKR